MKQESSPTPSSQPNYAPILWIHCQITLPWSKSASRTPPSHPKCTWELQMHCHIDHLWSKTASKTPPRYPKWTPDLQIQCHITLRWSKSLPIPSQHNQNMFQNFTQIVRSPVHEQKYLQDPSLTPKIHFTTSSAMSYCQPAKQEPLQDSSPTHTINTRT